MPEKPLEQALGALAAASDHDLIMMTAQMVLIIKHEDIPGIITRLDHTNGGFKDHEDRLCKVEECFKIQEAEKKREREDKTEIAQAAVSENNRLQANLLKRIAWPVGLAVILGSFIASVIGPLIDKLAAK